MGFVLKNGGSTIYGIYDWEIEEKEVLVKSKNPERDGSFFQK